MVPFFSQGHTVTEFQADDERFSKRDPLMAQDQCDREPVPHVPMLALPKLE